MANDIGARTGGMNMRKINHREEKMQRRGSPIRAEKAGKGLLI
jgi:hypothetical protein